MDQHTYNLTTTLTQTFGFATFRSGQTEAIQSLLAQQDTLVVMPTGSGKSLIYQLAAVCLPPPKITLVISPLIALMQDQVESLTRQTIPATFINSSLPINEQNHRMRAVAEGHYRIVYVAPERLRSRLFLGLLRHLEIGLLAVDEAHCISQWGHDFRPDYRRIAAARASLGNPLTVALTATATTLVQDDILTQLDIPHAKRIVMGFNRANLSFDVRYVSDSSSKPAVLHTLFSSFREQQGTAIVYTSTRREAEMVATLLKKKTGLPIEYYHAGRPSEERRIIQQAFMAGKVPVVVATNAFGMGIDRPDVRLVVHYSMPGTLEAYYQEAGRAGRDGAPAQAVLIYAAQDRLLHQRFIDGAQVTVDDLRAVYTQLAQHGDSKIQTSEHALAEMTRRDIANVRTALAYLERSRFLSINDDLGPSIVLSLHGWDDEQAELLAAESRKHAHHRQQKLDQMSFYAETDTCRRQVLLQYFSDQGSIEDTPVCCDNCTIAHSRSDFESIRELSALSRAERATLIILTTVRQLPWGVGRHRLAELLTGSKNKHMTPIYQRQPYFGRFKEFSLKTVEGWIEYLVIHGYLKITGGSMPTIALTARGEHALRTRNPPAVDLNEPSKPAKRARVGSTDTVNDTLILLRQGLHPAEIATARELTVGTIYKHLSQMIEEEQLALADVIEHTTVQQVQEAIREIGSMDLLAPLKAYLPEHISYGEIQCVIAALRREQLVQRTTLTSDDTPNLAPPNLSSLDPSRRDRARHIFELGNTGNTCAVPELINALKDSNYNVRRLAASALGKLKDQRAVPALLDRLAHETAPQVRQYIVTALGRIGDPKAIPTLQAIAADTTEKDYIRRAAQVALRQFPLRT